MKALKWIGTISVVMAVVIGIWGCEKMRAPTEPTASIEGKKSNDVTSTETFWEASETIEYKNGGKLKIDKLFSLKVKPKSMTDEYNNPVDENITGAVKLDNGELLFNFKPDGLTFNPAAELTLKWHKLDVGEWETINLYYLPDGKDGQPVLISDSNDDSGRYKWDKANKVVWFEISHFSLYALSKD